MGSRSAEACHRELQLYLGHEGDNEPYNQGVALTLFKTTQKALTGGTRTKKSQGHLSNWTSSNVMPQQIIVLRV